MQNLKNLAREESKREGKNHEECIFISFEAAKSYDILFWHQRDTEIQRYGATRVDHKQNFGCWSEPLNLQ